MEKETLKERKEALTDIYSGRSPSELTEEYKAYVKDGDFGMFYKVLMKEILKRKELNNLEKTTVRDLEDSCTKMNLDRLVEIVNKPLPKLESCEDVSPVDIKNRLRQFQSEGYELVKGWYKMKLSNECAENKELLKIRLIKNAFTT